MITLAEIAQVLTAAGVVVAMLLNLRTLRAGAHADNPHIIEMRADIKHIREKVDEQAVLTRQLDEKYDRLRDRVTTVEAGAASTHRRLDDMIKLQ